MKKITFLLPFLLCLIFYNYSFSQISSAQTINFDTADNTNLGPVANDGEGGSTSITGVQINIFAINAAGTATNADLIFNTTSVGFGANIEEGLSIGTDPATAAWRGIAIKSNDGSEFDFNGFESWEFSFSGTVTLNVRGYKNGVATGSGPKVITTGNGDRKEHPASDFSDADFGDVDEVRIIATTDYYGTFDVFLLGAVVVPNAVPTFTTFSGAVETTNEDTSVEISFAELAAKGDEADSDGTVNSFVVQALSSGTLTINGNPYFAGFNEEITAVASATWTPASGATGTINAFTVKAKDNAGALSTTAVQATVTVNATDATAPTLSSSSPTDDATGIAISSNITLTFNENISFGTGNIQVIDVTDGSNSFTIDVTNPGTQASISGAVLTINPSTNLDDSSNYAIQIATTAIDDAAGNSFAGVTDNTTLNFTTADTTAPVFENSTPSSASITQTGFTLATDINEAGTIYYIVVTDGDAPTAAQVKTANAGNGSTLRASGNTTVNTGGFTHNFSVTGLTAGTAYDVYVVAEDDEGTPNLQTTPTKIAVTTSAQPTIAFSATSSNELESVNSKDIVVALSATSTSTITVNYAVTGTATGSGTDYTLADGTLTITAGNNSGNITIASIVDDVIDENNETVIVTLSSPTNATLGTSTTHTYTINDNDASPTIAFNSTTSSGAESTTSANVQVNLSAISGRDVTVDYVVSGTATGSGTDYTLADGTLTLNAGETTKNISIANIVDDAILEANETIIITLSNPSNATLGTNTVHTYTINDNDSASVTIADVSGNENDGNITVTATLNNAVQGGFTVDVNTADGTATTADSDYTAITSQTLTFTGSAGETQTFTITPTADTKVEANETLTVSMNNLASTTLGVTITDTATITINNDDVAIPTISFSNTSSSGLESVNSKDIEVALSAVSASSVTVNYTVSGTATNGTDYTLADGTLTLNAGETTKNITIASIVDDAILEANETVIITLSNPTNATLGTNTVHTYTINDNDSASVTIANVSGNENDGNITVTATLDNAVQGGFTVDVNTADGTATTADSDYTAITSQTLTFAGTAGESQTFTITPTADTKFEADETLTVSMNNLESTSLGVTITDTATITINNDDLEIPTITNFQNVTYAYGTSNVILNANSDSGGIITYSIVGANNTGTTLSGTNNRIVTLGNVGTVTIRATVAANGSFASGTKDITLTIEKANQTISFGDGASVMKALGITPYTLAATATSGGEITFVSSNTDVATISGNTVTLVGIGTSNIIASQAGTSNYNPATTTQSLTVIAVLPTVTTNAATTITVEGATLNGNITSDGGSAIIERGFVFSLTETEDNPLIGQAGVTTVQIQGATGAINSSITGLSLVKNYSYKAYAKNATGISYGEVQTFTTANPITINSVTSDKADGIYGIGETIPITITFSETVNVTGSPKLDLSTGSGTTRSAIYSSGSGTSNLIFSYVVLEGDNTNDLAYKATSALSLSSGTIKSTNNDAAILTLPAVGALNSLSSNKDIQLDGIKPTITNLTIPADGTYAPGDNLSFEFSISEAISVDMLIATGVPYLSLVIGSNQREAELQRSENNVTSLIFKYVVASDDVDADGIGVGQISLQLAKILDAANNNLNLTFTSPNTAGILVGGKPTVTNSAATAITPNSATLHGEVTANGGATITERGFIYAKTSDDATLTLAEVNGEKVFKVIATETSDTFKKEIASLLAHTEYSFIAYATNSVGTTESTVKTFTSGNSDPVFTAGEILQIVVCDKVNYELKVNDPDGDVVSLKLGSNAPDWLKLTNKTLSGTLDNSVNLSEFKIIAEDSYGGKKELLVNFVRYNISAPSVDLGEVITFAVDDADGVIQEAGIIFAKNDVKDALTIDNIKNSPDVFQLSLNDYCKDQNSCTLTFDLDLFKSNGINLQNVTTYKYAFYVSTCEGTGYVIGAQNTFTTINTKPTITSSPVLTVNVGETYTYPITTEDVDGDAVTVTATTKPDWLAISGSGNAGEVTTVAPSESFNYPYGVAVDASGNVYVTDSYNNKVKKIATDGSVIILAPSESFNNPTGIAVDALGNVYVVDTGNNKIKKIAGDGSVSILAPSESFYNPNGIALDASGNVYVVDTNNDKIKKIAKDGSVTILLLGSGGTYKGIAVDVSGNVYVTDSYLYFITKIATDGSVTRLTNSVEPTNGIAVDTSGNVYVVEGHRDRIKKISGDGSVTTILAPSEKFYDATGVAVDASGNVYVAEFGNNKIKKIAAGTFLTGTAPTTVGTHTVTLTADDGNGGTATQPFTINVIDKPTVTSSAASSITANSATLNGEVTADGGTTITERGFVYTKTSDDDTPTLAEVDDTKVFKVIANGITVDAFTKEIANLIANTEYSFIAYTTNSVGTSESAVTTFTTTNTEPIFTSTPELTVIEGEIYTYSITTEDADDDEVTFTPSNQILPSWLKISGIGNEGQVSTIAGTRKIGFRDGIGSQALFNGGRGLVTDLKGNIYLADTYNHKIRKITPEGVVSTLAGSTHGYKDGDIANAKFSSPYDITIDKSGNLYVVEYSNSAVRKITPGGIVSTIAGGPAFYGFADGPVETAKFSEPQGIALDSEGNIYIADTGNNKIRKINLTSNTVSTLADVSDPKFIDIDSKNNIYVTLVRGNNDVLKISLSGDVSNFISFKKLGVRDGFSELKGIKIDKDDNIYLLENYKVHRVTQEGKITTIAGSETKGFIDGVGTSAQFEFLKGITVDYKGNIYVTDLASIRKVSPGTFLTATAPNEAGTHKVTLTANDGNGGTALQNFTIEVIGKPVAVISADGKTATNKAFNVNFTFDQEVTGFDVGDLIITSAVLNTFEAVSTTLYRATIQPLSEGEVTINIPANVAESLMQTIKNKASEEFTILYDRTPPTKPVITSISDYTCDGNTNRTGDNTLLISGTAEAASIVEIFINDVSVGTTTASSGGQFTFDHTGTTLADGTYTITVKATDAAGNGSDVSDVFTIIVDTIDNNGDKIADFCTSEKASDVTIKETKTYGFSPNGDGVNDGWYIEGITKFENSVVQIFSRSGRLVFKKSNYKNDWEGFPNQGGNQTVKLPAGPYLFLIDLGDGSKPTRGWLYISY